MSEHCPLNSTHEQTDNAISMNARSDGGVGAPRKKERNFKTGYETGYKSTWEVASTLPDMNYRPNFLFNV
jgi:hypothetical protein